MVTASLQQKLLKLGINSTCTYCNLDRVIKRVKENISRFFNVRTVIMFFLITMVMWVSIIKLLAVENESHSFPCQHATVRSNRHCPSGWDFYNESQKGSRELYHILVKKIKESQNTSEDLLTIGSY